MQTIATIGKSRTQKSTMHRIQALDEASAGQKKLVPVRCLSEDPCRAKNQEPMM